MLNVTNKSFMLSVVRLSVLMLNVVTANLPKALSDLAINTLLPITYF